MFFGLPHTFSTGLAVLAMGNQGSHNQRTGYPTQQLKYKVGDKTDPVPCPYAVAKPNYQSIYNDPNFKDYVLRNLNSNPLLRSILQHSSDESIILEGIPYFSSSTREKRTEINNDVKKFQDFILSGLQVISIFFE
jgi:hypothetical protein